MTTNSHDRSRRVVATLVSAAVVLSIASFGGAAQAEACTDGTPMRTLTEDETGFISNQVCLQGEWVPISRWQIKPEELVINETVEQPQDSKYHLTAEAFFDLKNYDPYAIITAFRDVVERGKKLTETDMTDLLLKSARTDAQALLARSTRLDPSENCQVRSQPAAWKGPEPFTLTPGGPKVITYAFDPSLSTAQKVIALNALSQYRPAVEAQDFVGKYPEDIVPDDPADPRPPTITFLSRSATELPSNDEAGNPGGMVVAATKATVLRFELGLHPTLINSEISLIDRPELLNPAVVAHEIGHSLGQGHSSNDLTSTMRPNGPPVNTIAPWDVRNSHNDTPAFDACMFLPTDE